MNLLLKNYNLFKSIIPLLFLYNFFDLAYISIIDNNLINLFSFLIIMLSSLLIKAYHKQRLFQIVFNFNVFFVLLFFHYYNYKFGLPYEYGGTDDLRYENAIASYYYSTNSIFEIINQFYLKAYILNSDNYILFSNLILYPYKFLGFEYHTLALRIINSLFISFTSLIIYSVVKNFKLTSIESAAGSLLYGIFPIIVFEGAHIYRDTINAFSFIFIFYYLMPLNGMNKFDKSYIYKTPLFIASLFIASTFRVGYNLITIFIISVIVFFSQYKQKINLAIFYICITIGIIFFSFFINIYVISFYNSYVEYNKNMYNPDGLTSFIFDLPMYLGFIVRSFFIHLTPLPVFDFNTLNEAFQKLGTVLWLYFLPILYKNIFNNDKRIQLLMTIYILLHYSVAFTTMQTRQFTTFIPFAIIIIAIGLKDKYIDLNKFYFFVISILLAGSFYGNI